jgi:hypothetical protein
MHMCVCVCVYICIHTYIHTYVHIHVIYPAGGLYYQSTKKKDYLVDFELEGREEKGFCFIYLALLFQDAPKHLYIAYTSSLRPHIPVV